MASLHAAGFDQPVMTIHDPEKRGALPTWGRAVAALIASTADWLMIVQDDASWARRSREALEREILALGDRAWRAGLLSPFLVNKIGRELRQRGDLRPGWHPSTLGYQSGGALCYVLPRASAEALMADPWFAECLATRPKNIDRWVPGRLLELGYDTLYRYPSLVNHVLGSGNSSIKPKKPHDTQFWERVAS